ncbi:MAG: RNA polymerase sigma factor [Spirochaetales bacterium]|nr:RNA polymerase sigma factor [Spirochaetales bacterium]
MGKPEDLKKLYIHYKEPLLYFLLIHLKGNRSIADDILHETFEIVIKKIVKIKTKKNLKSWLFNIAYKRLLLYYRKQKYDKEKIRLFINEKICINYETQELLEKKEKNLLITLALERIKSGYKKAIEMKYINGYSQKEIAKKLNKTEGAVEQLLNRAKKAMRNEISTLHDNYFKKGGIK